MKSFIDTNVSISYVFLFEPHCKYAEYIFNEEYSKIYWSNNVCLEFENRVIEKRNKLLNFYNNLMVEVNNYNKMYYSLNQLKDFANDFNYQNNKEKNDVLSSVDMFWNYYSPFSDSMVIDAMIDSVRHFHDSISRCIFERKDFCENLLVNINDFYRRTENYSELFGLLSDNGVHDEDIQIILDAYDFSKTLQTPLDFITFNRDCCTGASDSSLNFNEIKCLDYYDNNFKCLFNN